MGCSVLARDLDEQARLALVADLEESELGLVAFARSRGVNPSTLYRWGERHKRGHPLVGCSPGAEACTDQEPERVGFSEVVVPPLEPSGRPPVVVHLPLGVRVEIPAELVEGGLRRLLREGSRC